MNNHLKIQHKEPWVGVIFSSFIPGTGQCYLGYCLRGFIIFVTSIFTLSFALWCIVSSVGNIKLGIFAGLFYVGFYIWNLFDAFWLKRYFIEKNGNINGSSKDPWLAVFLSYLFPGIGHMYLRKYILGIIFMTISIIVIRFRGLRYWILFFPIFSGFVCYTAYKSGHIKRSNSKYLIMIVLCIVIISNILIMIIPKAIRQYIVQPYKVLNNSMEPGLKNGDIVLVTKQFGNYIPQRGDLVAYSPKYSIKWKQLKRIAGLPYETIEINNKVFINGKILNTIPFNKIEYTSVERNGQKCKPIKIPSNNYYLLGDNSYHSIDSRFYGAISRDKIIGKVYKIIWPIYRSGPVK